MTDVVFSGGPTVIGHRGMGAGTVDGQEENTLSSFLAAVDAGLDWVEVDVRRTVDDGLVVAHNPAYGDGVFYVDQPTPVARDRATLLLADLLDALPEHVGVDFDLKSSMEDAGRAPDATTASLLARVAAKESHRRPLAVTSFDPAALLTVRAAAPEVTTGLLTWIRFPIGLAVAAAAHLDVQFLATHVGSLKATHIEPEPQHRPLDYVVSLLHDAGRQVAAWCPAADELGPLVEAGVDAVCVNDGPAALRALGR